MSYSITARRGVENRIYIPVSGATGAWTGSFKAGAGSDGPWNVIGSVTFDTDRAIVVLSSIDMASSNFPGTYKLYHDATVVQSGSVSVIEQPVSSGGDGEGGLSEEEVTTIANSAVAGHASATSVHGATGAVVGTTNTQTLTNKTLTSPVINSPTGITKTNVGLGNVDNTSDATKNSATATLTNKTLTAPVINSPTGITKSDVGLANVDNTADTAKPISTATQTALDAKAADTAVVHKASAEDITGSKTFVATPSSTKVLNVKITGDAATRLRVAADGGIEFGDGTTANLTNLYRVGSGLRSDGVIDAAGLTIDGVAVGTSEGSVDTTAIHKTGTETAAGEKTFTGRVNFEGDAQVGPDSNNFYMGALGDTSGVWVDAVLGSSNPNVSVNIRAKGPSGIVELHSPVVANEGITIDGSTVATAADLNDLTKSDVGLGNVDNTSDANKPVSTAQQTALDLKANASDVATDAELSTHASSTATHGATGAIVGTTNTQTLTNKTLTSPVINSPTGITKANVGLGNVDNTADADKPISSTTQTALDAKADDADLTAHTGGTVVHGATGAVVGTTNTQTLTNKTLTSPVINSPTGITKSDVGLSNVDNTSDANKPVSTATQTALDGKQTLDSDLTAIAGLSPTNDDIVQRKAGAWTNRTPAQLKTDLSLTKTDVGLANVDNTADTAKPISTATQTALDAKAAAADLTTHTSATAAHGATGAVVGTTNTQTLTNKTLTSPVINSPTGIVKADVGLANVDNTSDTNKPVSTATQTALNKKFDDYLFGPDDHGFLAWNGDPATCPGGTLLGTAGTMFVVKIKVPEDITVTNIHNYLTAVGVTLTSNQCFAALYQADGTHLRTSVSQATNWSGSPGLQTMALSSSVAITAGFYYIGLWYNGTTAPTFARFAVTASGLHNAGLAAADARFATTSNTGLTTQGTAPGTIGTKTLSSSAYWVALS